jgi:hypothetical protein
VRASSSISIRVLAIFAAGLFVLGLTQYASAQDDGNDTPLGDVARSLRKKPASSEMVIDNDNFSKVVDDAESRHAAGSSLVFSLEPGGKNFNVSSPDVSCSLSFSAKTSSLLADPAMLDELPRSELAKLDGPATLDGDSLQVSVHNGSSWQLREVVIGLTIIRKPDTEAASGYGAARIVPAVDGPYHPIQDSSQKQPDDTILLRVKGAAEPSATAVFRTPLNFALFPDQEWHWAIVRAKGIPTQPPADAAAIQAAQNNLLAPQAVPDTSAQSTPSAPASSSPANPNSLANPNATAQ